jgi:hypothetical protein
MKSKDKEEWVAEMVKEIEALIEMGAFQRGFFTHSLPDGVTMQDIIRSIWVYDVKVDGRKRARFAARGDMEDTDDGDDRHSPVTQMETVRLLLAVAAQLNLEIFTLDFPKAFLLGRMSDVKKIYMHAPEGFGEPGEVWLIVLPLCGLTVSSRRFYEALSEFLRAIGFEHFSGGDPCLFRRVKRLPSKKETACNTAKAVAKGLAARPLSAPPLGPLPARIGPCEQHEYPYPEYMELPEYKDSPNVPFEPHHATGLGPNAMNGLFPGEYVELAATYVDDLIGGSHEAAVVADEFIRRSGAKLSPPGSMYLGLGFEQNLAEGWISIDFEKYLLRAMERILSLEPEEITVPMMAGILLWLTMHVFATYLVECKAFTRRANQNLPEDGKLALALFYEIFARRGQKIYFKRIDPNNASSTVFEGRSSRVEGVADVSQFYGPVPEANGEVIVTPKDILDADGGIDIYAPDFDDPMPDPEIFVPDMRFQINIYNDGSFAKDRESRRSDIGHILSVNGGPVNWSAIRMGVAQSSYGAEYIGNNVGTMALYPVVNKLNFMGGIMPAVVDQWCDSTSAKQSAVNPHSLGASRALGIRMHGTRFAISRNHLTLRYVITEDQVSGFTTKRMPRKHLARLAVIFYNNLKPNWKEDPNVLKPLRDAKWYPELK